MTAIVTDHASRRCRKRLGIPKKAVPRLVNQALSGGRHHKDIKGRLKRYIDRVFLDERKANNIRVYREYIFLFHDNVLITAWILPEKYR